MKNTKEKSPIIDQYIWSATGKRIYVNNPKVEDFYLEDIALGLSRACRFNGQMKATIPFYSVAEHSVAVAKLYIEKYWTTAWDIELAKNEALLALLHDAAEAYLGDITQPIKVDKAINNAYSPIEDKFMKAISRRFEFPYNKRAKARVKVFDNVMGQTEITTIITLPQDENYKTTVWTRPELIKGLLPHEAYELFLDTYWEIMKL